jgi:hypothetical protein
MARLSERAGLVGLAAFLVVDVLLVGFAVNSTRHPVEQGGTTIDSGVTTPTRSTTGKGSPTADPTAPAVKVVPLTVGIVGLDKDTAFRFTTGSCKSGGAKLELTRNAGESWGPRSVSYDTIVRVRVRSDGSAFVVGADAGSDCTPSIRQASGLDADFGDSVVVNDAWFRDPRSSTSVGLPSGGVGKPCGSGQVVDLAVVDSGAAALCSDGRVRVSPTGQSWETAAKVEGALALAMNPKARTFLAVPGVDSCDGLAVIDAAKPETAIGCADAPLADVKPGTVALSVNGGAGWLGVGDTVYRAGASLTTWKKS